MITKTVEVIKYIDVTVDETKFSPEFLEEFPKVFYKDVQTLEDHMRFLAEQACHNNDMNYGDHFQEGYGRLDKMGIDIKVVGVDSEILDEE